MGSIYILLGVSALEGFVLGLLYLSWIAAAISGLVLAPIAALVLQAQGFWAAPGIAVIVGCLTCNQLLLSGGG